MDHRERIIKSYKFLVGNLMKSQLLRKKLMELIAIKYIY